MTMDLQPASRKGGFRPAAVEMQWQECANSGHRPDVAADAGQIDLELPFEIGSYETGVKHEKAGL